MMCKTERAPRATARRWIEGLLLVCGALLSGCVYDWDKPGDASADLDGDGEVDVVDPPGDDSSVDEEHDATLPEDDLDASLPEPDAEPPEPDAEGDLDGQLPDAEEMDAGYDAAFWDSLDAFFQADFEDGSIGFSWHELTQDSGASLSLVDGGTGPGSVALKASLSGVLEEAARVALYVADDEPQSLHVAFDLLPQFSLEQGEAVYWFKLTTHTGDQYPGVGLATNSKGENMLLVQNFDGTFSNHAAGDLPSGWVHVDVEVRLGAEGVATVYLNGHLAGGFKGPLQTPDVEKVFLQLGVYTQNPSVSSALFDNVVVHVVP